MLGASIGLIVEGATLDNINQPIIRLIIGMVLGLVLVFVSRNLLSEQANDFHIGKVQAARQTDVPFGISTRLIAKPSGML